MSSATDILRERALHATAVSKQAVLSRTYLYPPLGVLYFLRHPSLWPPVLNRILPSLLLSLAVLVPMFLFTYIPQAGILGFLNGPIGAINAAALVLSESSFIINHIARTFLLDQALLDLFDATLVCEGQEALVSKGRELNPGKAFTGTKKLGKLVSKPFHKFSPASIVDYFIMLPLNLIPLVGTASFLVLQGRKTGPGYHSRYFQLKGFDESQRNAFIQEHHGGYIAFGTTNMVMNLIPLVSTFFTFTSTVGAALWAAEIEKKANFPGETVDISGDGEEPQRYPLKKSL